MPHYRKDYPRIRLIRFNCWERPKRAIITTKYGIVKVRWEDGKWFSEGDPRAKEEAIAAIGHIENIGESMH